ncbi:MAG: YdiU family protein [Bdellovibrionales bacterium]|nr:YdiU family protein [Bdellovibrionales bacterium]
MKNILTNSYLDLPSRFYSKISPSNSFEPQLIHYNKELGQQLGLDLDNSTSTELAQIFSGQKLFSGSDPIALVYAGHQFGHFVPQLGDGRALLLGEVKTSRGTFDLQLKGSGVTPFSRGGDGLSPLGPVIREFIVSEAMAHLGVPTTRTLAAVLTGATVYREQPLPGAVSTRVASSHLRIGTFEYFSNRKDVEGLRILADYAIQRHDPDLISKKEKYLQFFRRVCLRQMDLVSKWMGLGFIHGVMNTDNMTISGESIDFGPCAFMDNFEFLKVFSSIDRHGRYAYDRQPEVALWNFTCLANALIPLVHDDKKVAIAMLEEILKPMPQYFEQENLKTMAFKMGIFNPINSDRKIIADFLKYLQDEKLDFTNSFRQLSQKLESHEPHLQSWQNRVKLQSQSIKAVKTFMNQNNPAMIPRNHQVEKAISMAYQGDFSHFLKLLEITKKPFDDNEEFAVFTEPPRACEVVNKTFCGT